MLNGQGAYTFPDGEEYVGAFRDDQRDGQGTYTWPDGRKYVGEFRNDQANGQGVMISSDGPALEGVWEDGEYLQTVAELIEAESE